MNNPAYVYIPTNKNRTTLYIGVTNDLVHRIEEHRRGIYNNSFTSRYNLEFCIYYEEFSSFEFAILREKELKKWNRKKKEDLINSKNPSWKTLVNENRFSKSPESFSEKVRTVVKEILTENPNTEFGDEDFNSKINDSSRRSE